MIRDGRYNSREGRYNSREGRYNSREGIIGYGFGCEL